MRVCDWIADYFYNLGITKVHGLMGGGAMGLNDGFIKHGKINYICYHHEQGAGHAAIGESKFTGRISLVNPTTGCGGTNCATSVLNAWQDGVPVIFISGNVKLSNCSGYLNQLKNTNIRKFGVQEHHIVSTYETITKFSKFITKAEEVPYYIEKAVYESTNGRPGPVWIDIPADIQTANMPNEYPVFEPDIEKSSFDEYSSSILKMEFFKYERPLVLAGYGIRQSNTVDKFVEFITKYQIPFVSTYGARDYFLEDHPLNIGAVGIKGSRAGNFAMQNCNALMVLGSSLNGSVIGYDPNQFSPKSFKVVIDIDSDELKKSYFKIDVPIKCSLQEFFEFMI